MTYGGRVRDGGVDYSGNGGLRPVITIDKSILNIEPTSEYQIPTGTATDNCGGSTSVTTSGSVNTSVPGNYPIKYSSTDNAGNNTTLNLTVNVLDKTSPQINFDPIPDDSYHSSNYDVILTATDDVEVTSLLYCQTTGNNSSCTPTIVANPEGTSIIIKTDSDYHVICAQATDSSGNITNACSNDTGKYYKLDTTAPVISGVTTTSNLKSTSQTVTLNCSDNLGVISYYFGTSSSPLDSDFTSVTSTTNLSLTKTVDSAGTYYLLCKDGTGNISNTGTTVPTGKITYYNYTVNNRYLTTTGTKGTYTTSNYASNSSYTYIAPSGTSLTASGIYTAPSYSDYVGISKGEASTTSATLLTSTPTLSSTETYVLWFNRKEYTLTLSSGTGIASVSGSGTYRYGQSVSIDATVSSGYAWSKWSVTSGTTPSTFTAGTKSQTIVMGGGNVTLTASAVSASGTSYNVTGVCGSNCEDITSRTGIYPGANVTIRVFKPLSNKPGKDISCSFKNSSTGTASSISYTKSCEKITAPGGYEYDCDVSFTMPSYNVTITCDIST